MPLGGKKRAEPAIRNDNDLLSVKAAGTPEVAR
jgi:hypothetical protein